MVATTPITTHPTPDPSPAAEAGGTGRRAEVLQGLRGVTVVAVVGYHALRIVLARDGSGWGDSASPMWWWAGIARFGVDVFFVLAGFLIVSSWRRCRTQHRSLGATVRDYAARRAWRILPTFWASLLVFVPLAAPQLLSADRFGDLVRLLTVQQYTVTSLPAEVNLPTWSLTTEVHFYVLVPLIALVARGRWAAVLLAGALAVSVTWLNLGSRPLDLADSTIFGRIDQFVAGAAAAELVAAARAGRDVWLARALASPIAGRMLLGGLVVLGIFHGATFERASGLLVSLTHPLAGLLLAGAAVHLVLGGPFPRLCARPLVALGTISYSLYLFHYPVLHHGFEALGFRDGSDQPALMAAVAMAGLVAVAVAMAVGVHLVVERPAERWKRRRVEASLSGR